MVSELLRRFIFSLAIVVGLSLVVNPVVQAENLVWSGPGSAASFYPPHDSFNPWLFPLTSSSNNQFLISADLNVIGAGGYFYGGNGAEGEVLGNLVKVEGTGLIALTPIFGGFGQIGQAGDLFNGSLKTSRNTIILRQAQFGVGQNAYGGFNRINGGGNLQADYNTLILENSQAHYVIGGHNEVTASTLESTGTANYNRVEIIDSSVALNVIGGDNVRLTQGQAIYNTVILRGNTSVGRSVHGGLNSNTTGDVFTGNRLWVVNPKSGGIEVGNNVRGFENFAFVLDPLQPTGSVALNVTGEVHLGDLNGRGAKIESLDMYEGSMPEEGYEFVLFKADGAIRDDDFTQQTVQGLKKLNFELNYDLVLSKPVVGSDTLTAVFRGFQVQPQMETVSAGRSSGLAFLNQGLDQVADQGLGAAMGRPFLSPCPAVFMTVSGGVSRYDIADRFELKGLNALVGVDCNSFLDSGILTLGGFLEVGQGRFDSRMNLPKNQIVDSDGQIKYIGGGVLGRFDFDSPGLGKNYLEASLRGGRLTLDFSSFDFINSPGEVTFDSDGQYVGGHLAVGRIFNLAESKTLDLYGKYLFTSLAGDEVVVGESTPVAFERSSSHRLRAGSRFSANLSPGFKLLAGLGYEYEFDGQTKAVTEGSRIKTLKTSGGTALAELGLSYRRSGRVPMTFTIGTQGWLGRRDGVSGSIQMTFEF
ncbi:MAG: autotransporter outer membrane beta-barrel domain-containing protein [Deltaproteobacteria bacterium]|jgi:hypothetical protein|nr:autotransporter outer membrane beta-barrel domain-containing protein [Deltaproteobacteria bacterium]